MNSARRWTGLTTVLVTSALTCFVLAATASAADSIYWTNYNTPGIGRVNLAGGEAGSLPAAATPTIESAYGLAFDSLSGRFYVDSAENNKVAFTDSTGSAWGELDLTSPPGVADFPDGLTIDPATRRIYWANAGNDTIGFASLDGSGAGLLPTGSATIEVPEGPVIDPATRRIYWANNQGGSIAWANLDGSGGGNLDTTGAPVEEPVGLTIDAATNQVYWANAGNNTIGFANLSGGGGGTLNTTGATLNYPNGVAIDPAAGRIYVASYFSETISYVNLDGSGGGNLDTTGAAVAGPAFPILLKAPVAQTQPLVSGTLKAGSTLGCSTGGWGADLFESSLYRAPHSFSYQWTENGLPISGATTNTLVASTAGSYACAVAASNLAGSTSQTSAAATVPAAPVVGKVKVLKVKKNLRRGTATVKVEVAPAGKVTLSGKLVVKQTKSKSTPGVVTLMIKTKGAATRALKAKGKAKVKATIAFTPKGGPTVTKTRTFALRKLAR